jgi:hypothetical protein
MGRNVFGRVLLMLAAPILLSAAAPAKADRASLMTFLGEVQKAFQSDPERFKALHGGSELVAQSERLKLPRIPGEPRILRLDERRGEGVVLLSGRIESGDSGDHTWMSMLYTGLYRVTAGSESWRLGQKIPLGVSRISSQTLDVDLTPGSGLKVKDELAVENTASGFAAILNLKAQLREVRLNGRPVTHIFQDGLLWVDAPAGKHKLFVSYDLPVERPEGGGNSAAFLDHAGHVRNQYSWHPNFWFGEEKGAADFAITVRAPERVKVALDIPQSEQVKDGVRTVRGKSYAPIMLSTLSYDADWNVRRFKVGMIELDLFATDDHSPKPEEFLPELEALWNSLSTRFGTPAQKRISIVQGRARQGNGWHYMSNQAIVTGPKGGAPVVASRFLPRGFFPHEVAHLWVNPSGDARNFLGEGWATYAESLLMRGRFGEETERWFWSDHQRNFLYNEAHRSISLIKDQANSGASYSKGAWIFAMLERLVGSAAFDRAIRAYSAAPLGRTDLAGFIAAFGPEAGKVERFIKPWVEEAGGVRLTPTKEAGQLLLVQQGPRYWLPGFEVIVEYADGSSRSLKIDIEGERTLLPPATAEAVKVRLDPNEAYLMETPRVVQLKGS